VYKRVLLSSLLGGDQIETILTPRRNIMKKTTDKKLSLHRESLRLLTPGALRPVEGGIGPYSSWPTDPISCARNPDTE
jgi:hypothetical protein